MKPLILIGGGGHCKSVIEAAESAGYRILGVLDLPEKVGKESPCNGRRICDMLWNFRRRKAPVRGRGGRDRVRCFLLWVSLIILPRVLNFIIR